MQIQGQKGIRQKEGEAMFWSPLRENKMYCGNRRVQNGSTEQGGGKNIIFLNNRNKIIESGHFSF